MSDARTHLYFCGPSPFMNAVDAVARTSMRAERIHQEHFCAPDRGADRSDGFQIELARSKRVLAVPPHKSIADVLYEHGVPLEISCEAGICGACRTTVLEGTPDHRDAFLSSAEKALNNAIMPCVSRAKTGRLVLDI